MKNLTALNALTANDTALTAPLDLTAMQTTMHKSVLTASLIEKLDAVLVKPQTTANNRKKAEKYKRFFEYNQRALDLLAHDNANAEFIGDQLYAVQKLFDLLRVAVAGHREIENDSIMHHFLLRTLKSFANLQRAGAAINVNHVIDCAISNKNAPKGEFANLIVCSDKARDNENAQRPQVINVLRTLRILTAENAVNLETKVAQAVLATLETYDGKELATA